MGETLCYEAIRRCVETFPALILTGYRHSKHLGEYLAPLGININPDNDAEMDIAALAVAHHKMNATFGEVKTLLR